MSADHMTLVIFTFFWALSSPYIVNAALLWLPVIGEIRPVPMYLAGQRSIILAGIVTIAVTGGVRAFLRFDPPITVMFQMVGLTFALILGMLDWQDKWLPNYVTVPMLLTGLISASINQTTASAIYGSGVFWFAVTATMVIHSVIAKRNFMSGGDMTMAASCGAWIGIEQFAVYLGIVGVSHLAFCLIVRKEATSRSIDMAGEGLPLGPSLALGMFALTLIH